MKANQFAEREDAVSPVIGVILMVAITVVLAAVVFVLVSNLSDTNDQAPDIGLAKDESGDRINVVSSDSGLTWDQFRILADVEGGYGLNTGATNVAVLNEGGQAVATSGAVAAGDYIELCESVDGTAPMNVRIVHIETNTQVYETDFATLDVC